MKYLLYTKNIIYKNVATQHNGLKKKQDNMVLLIKIDLKN